MTPKTPEKPLTFEEALAQKLILPEVIHRSSYVPLPKERLANWYIKYLKGGLHRW